jgi:DNA-binding NtrC family response regulator
MNLTRFHSVLSSAKYEVVPALTADQAVAFCINNVAAAVVLDSEFFTVEGWSVAQTFKSLRPELPIVLFVEESHEMAVPQSVDAIAATGAALLQELHRLLDSADSAPNALAG